MPTKKPQKNGLVPSAKPINQAHERAKSSAQDAVQHAIECGNLLIATKKELEHGQFMPWCEKNLSFSLATANRYMQAAARKADAVAFSSLRSLFPSGAKKTVQIPHGVRNLPSKSLKSLKTTKKKKEKIDPEPIVEKPAKSIVAHVELPRDDEPERPDDVDEDEALALAEKDMFERYEKIAQSDDRLGEAMTQVKQQSKLIAVISLTRDGFMNGKEQITRLLKAEQNKNAKLQREIEKLKNEIESLKERIAIREEAA